MSPIYLQNQRIPINSYITLHVILAILRKVSHIVRLLEFDAFVKRKLFSTKGWGILKLGCWRGVIKVDSQVARVRLKNRVALLDTNSQAKDDTRIALVLTYHPALHKVYEIIRGNENVLLVDNEHKNVFKDKIFVSFRRAKNLKDKLVRGKLPDLDEELMEKGTFRCNGRKSCQICPLMREGDTFQNFNSTRSFKTFSGKYDCNSEHVVYLLECECCNKKYVESTKTKFRQRFNVYKSYFRSYSRKHNEGSLDKGKPIPQASFFGHFFENGHNGKFTVKIKVIDGAEDVYSLRRKELYWQYRLETFSPKGLNERAADVELDMFACGTA